MVAIDSSNIQAKVQGATFNSGQAKTLATKIAGETPYNGIAIDKLAIALKELLSTNPQIFSEIVDLMSYEGGDDEFFTSQGLQAFRTELEKIQPSETIDANSLKTAFNKAKQGNNISHDTSGGPTVGVTDLRSSSIDDYLKSMLNIQIPQEAGVDPTTAKQDQLAMVATSSSTDTIERTLAKSTVDKFAETMLDKDGKKLDEVTFKRILAVLVLVLGVDVTNKLAQKDNKEIQEIQKRIEGCIDSFLKFTFLQKNSDKEDLKTEWANLVDYLHGVEVNESKLACEYKTDKFKDFVESLKNADDNFIKAFLERAGQKEKTSYGMGEFVMDMIFFTGDSETDGVALNSLRKVVIETDAFINDVDSITQERSQEIYELLMQAEVIDAEGLNVKLSEVEAKVNEINDLSDNEKAHVLSVLKQSIKYNEEVFLTMVKAFVGYVQVNRDYEFLTEQDIKDKHNVLGSSDLANVLKNSPELRERYEKQYRENNPGVTPTEIDLVNLFILDLYRANLLEVDDINKKWIPRLFTKKDEKLEEILAKAANEVEHRLNSEPAKSVLEVLNAELISKGLKQDFQDIKDKEREVNDSKIWDFFDKNQYGAQKADFEEAQKNTNKATDASFRNSLMNGVNNDQGGFEKLVDNLKHFYFKDGPIRDLTAENVADIIKAGIKYLANSETVNSEGLWKAMDKAEKLIKNPPQPTT